MDVLYNLKSNRRRLVLGYDCGTSLIKATLLDTQTGGVVASATCPSKEMEIISKRPGWAEQNPQIWWENLVTVTRKIILQSNINTADIEAIGISYQMHGLVCMDKNKQLLRPSIIWCDSRAVKTGQKAASDLGQEKCFRMLANLPGNFTATRLKWLKDNEPEVYKKIYKIILPGDFIAMKMTGKITTTNSGLSEMILWDFVANGLCTSVMDYFGFLHSFIPDIVPTFGLQGYLNSDAAKELGLKVGVPISYRAGDQPNNALSLKVLNSGEIAATAGTSGVIYGVTDRIKYDSKSRVNTFVHVNDKNTAHRYGVLLCLSGAGVLNSWLKRNITDGLDYSKIDELASRAPVGSNGLVILPFGNGAERMLENKNIGAYICNLDFKTHQTPHILRAAQEGIAFALNYGLNIMKGIGVKVKTVKAGYANMFLSPIFAETFAAVTDSIVELYNTDGSQGAARGAGIGAGIYKNYKDAFVGLKRIKIIEPSKKMVSQCLEAYENWLDILNKNIKGNRI